MDDDDNHPIYWRYRKLLEQRNAPEPPVTTVHPGPPQHTDFAARQRARRQLLAEDPEADSVDSGLAGDP
jgi:hypothetical protein